MKVMVTFIITVLLVVFYWGWLFTMPDVTYTEKDFLKYYLLTRKEIRNAPRLSEDYYFEYGRSDESDPESSVIYTCGLSNVDEGYERLLSYVKKTGITLSEGYSWDNPPKRGEEYFYLGKISRNGDEECLMLMLSESFN
ncbi:hypothetical protein FHU10_4052 [Serratia fonticola]|uniref:Uncharacterized protein n=1 Tax=Serratia fonticola TaxID=47917 RepID=A0A542BR80_SERFO|nr:hypothetical protein [Serratia fonticola]TQI81046.1 hypothetical protein FHU09_3653 [Serratia fonticola]TQI96930.1 hypothetical protein FHU11_2392 [Serratia fonticola]TVZ71425.1 hypothetical protein FHU10_4052 [Serratia fonticola]